MIAVKIVPTHPDPLRMMIFLASNRATLLLLPLLALCIIIYYQVGFSAKIWLLIVPVSLLIVNFLLAVFIRQILKHNLALMVFHFSLLALVILVFAAQLTYFKATVELAEHEQFSGQLENISQGVWHRYGLQDSRFTNLGFKINYHKGIKRDRTINQVQLARPDGGQEIIQIGDHVPLVIGHYRFYTTHNKGYAPVFEWQAEGSNEIITGSIHLPAFPVHEYRQALEWTVPATQQTLWTLLKIEDDVLPEDRDFEFRIPQQHSLVLRYRGQRHELRPGEELRLKEGVLRYQRLVTWMGYKVDYDWTRPWLLAASMIGLMGLFLHFILKFSVSVFINNGRSD